MQSIPASNLVNVIPQVLTPGGNALSLNAVFFTEDPSIPINTAQSFPSALAVENWFGAESNEYAMAAVYFSGFTNSDALPGALNFFQYNASAVAGYLRGAPLTNVTLADLQAFSGVLDITINGNAVTSANINLASATSYSNAAVLITTGLQTTGGIFSGTATTTNGSPTLTINSTVSGVLSIGDTIVGTDIPLNTTITAFGTYTPTAGTGTVTMSANATAGVGPEAVTVSSTASCTYDSLRNAFVITSPTTGATSSVGYASGSLAADILLTQATGAVISAGAAATTPAAACNALVQQTQNWATFTTVFDPDNGAAPAPVKLAFAAWASQASPAGQERFAYVGWDSNAAVANGVVANSFGAQVEANDYNGTVPVWDLTSGQKAAFICGCAASIDYEQTDGRITFAYKGGAGLTADVTSATVAANLESNFYNFYGSYATATQQFTFLQPGSMPGAWTWIDPYINQIWLNANFQLALLELLSTVKSVPYNNQGYNLLRAAMYPTIQQALDNGVIQSNVQLTALQAAEVNAAAGTKIDSQLSTIGWYLQILPASGMVRGARTSPPMKFWYTDGGSIQSILLDSTDIE